MPPSNPAPSASDLTHIPPNQPLPPNWSLSPDLLHQSFEDTFPPELYALHKPQPLALSHDDLTFLFSGNDQIFIYSGIAGSLYRIDNPRTASAILSTMNEGGFAALGRAEVDILPGKGEVHSLRGGQGWLVYPDKELEEVRERLLGAKGLKGHFATCVLGKGGDDAVLVFRSEWKWFLVRKGTVYEIQAPQSLWDVARSLVTRGGEGLVLREVGKAKA